MLLNGKALYPQRRGHDAVGASARRHGGSAGPASPAFDSEILALTLSLTDPLAHTHAPEASPTAAKFSILELTPAPRPPPL